MTPDLCAALAQRDAAQSCYNHADPQDETAYLDALWALKSAEAHLSAVLAREREAAGVPGTVPRRLPWVS